MVHDCWLDLKNVDKMPKEYCKKDSDTGVATPSVEVLIPAVDISKVENDGVEFMLTSVELELTNEE